MTIAPVVVPTLKEFFNSYNIHHLVVLDRTGDGTEIYAYDANDNLILLPEDDDAINGYDYDIYLSLILDYLFKIGGRAHVMEGTIYFKEDGPHFNGNITTTLEV